MPCSALDHFFDDSRCAAPLFVTGDIYELRSDWQASARGRIGYAIDRTLFYGTGGAAFTQVRAYTNWVPDGVFPGVITSTSKPWWVRRSVPASSTP